MKPTLRICAIVIGLALTGCDGPAMKPYTSTAGNFRVDMPGEPIVTEQQVGSPVGPLTMHTVTASDRNKVSYNIMYSDYPAGMTKKENVNAVLEGACGGMISAAKLKETGREPISLDGHPGREVQFQLPGTSQGSGRARIFMVGDRIYQVLINGPESKISPERCSAFFNSFKFLEKKPSITESDS